MAGAPSSRPALNHSPEKGKYTGRSWRRSHARSKSKHSRPCRRPLPCPHLSLAFGAQPQRVLNGILIIPHWVADTLRQERDATMPTQTERESEKKKKGPWMSYIISRHKARTAPGRFRVCRRKDLRTKISTLRPLRPIFVFSFT